MSSDDLRHVLAAAGHPPAPDLRAIERAVWARLDECEPAAARTWLAGWARAWLTAGLFAAAFAVGVLSAAWRVQQPGAPLEADPHARYLQLIDPRARPALQQTS